jgi:L-ascorbate metabolism protein UlaG (beta-lactamase superfamily)
VKEGDTTMSVKIRFVGQAGFHIITQEGRGIIIDPFIKGDPNYSLPPSPVSAEELTPVDLVLVSHAAFDHLGCAIDIVKQTGALLICGVEVSSLAEQNGVPDENIRRVAWGISVKHRDISVKIVETHHQSFLRVNGKIVTGVPLGFVIRTKTGESIYHPGDTSLFSDIKLIGELHHPDVALLPIGGVISKGRHTIELDPFEAAIATEWLAPKVVIPMHYLPDEDDRPEQFAKYVEARSPSTRVVVLQPGESLQYT